MTQDSCHRIELACGGAIGTLKMSTKEERQRPRYVKFLGVAGSLGIGSVTRAA
jgi:hypothetical protein